VGKRPRIPRVPSGTALFREGFSAGDGEQIGREERIPRGSAGAARDDKRKKKQVPRSPTRPRDDRRTLLRGPQQQVPRDSLGVAGDDKRESGDRGITGFRAGAEYTVRSAREQFYDLSSLAPLARGICFRGDYHGLEEFDGLAPVGGEVVPGGVVALDQGDAAGANPMLDFFLAVDGGADVVKHLEIHQPIDLVLLGETGDLSCLVLRDAAGDVVGHSGVDAARLARQDVDEVAVFAGHGLWADERKAGPPRQGREG